MSCCGACLLRRGPVARPPIKAASDMGAAPELAGAASPLRAWLSPMSFRRVSSWFRCLSPGKVVVSGAGEGAPRESSFKLFATSVLAALTTRLLIRKLSTYVRVLRRTEISAHSAPRASAHASHPRSCNLFLEPPRLGLLVVVDLLLHCLDAGCPFRKPRLRLRGYTGRAMACADVATVHPVRPATQRGARK